MHFARDRGIASGTIRMTNQILPTILPRSFYLDSPEIVTRNLLGKLITHHVGRVRLSGRITEGGVPWPLRSGGSRFGWQDITKCCAFWRAWVLVCLSHLWDAPLLKRLVHA